MNVETVFVAIRYLLVAVGLFLVGRGSVRSEDWQAFLTSWDATAGGLAALITVLWGFYVNWKTKRVPEKEVAAKRLATVSPVTGKVERK